MKFTKAIASLGAGVMLLTVATTAPASAAAKTSVEPTGLTGIQQVSHTGRWVIGDGVRLDRATGERAPSWASTPTGSSTTQFVRDNPNLALERESMVDVVDADGDTVGYRSGPVWLTNSATGSRVRIDTDAHRCSVGTLVDSLRDRRTESQRHALYRRVPGLGDP